MSSPPDPPWHRCYRSVPSPVRGGGSPRSDLRSAPPLPPLAVPEESSPSSSAGQRPPAQPRRSPASRDSTHLAPSCSAPGMRLAELPPRPRPRPRPGGSEKGHGEPAAVGGTRWSRGSGRLSRSAEEGYASLCVLASSCRPPLSAGPARLSALPSPAPFLAPICSSVVCPVLPLRPGVPSALLIPVRGPQRLSPHPRPAPDSAGAPPGVGEGSQVGAGNSKGGRPTMERQRTSRHTKSQTR